MIQNIDMFEKLLSIEIIYQILNKNYHQIILATLDAQESLLCNALNKNKTIDIKHLHKSVELLKIIINSENMASKVLNLKKNQSFIVVIYQSWPSPNRLTL